MDSSGTNRYELLFMDDEAGPAPMPVAGAKKKSEDVSGPTKKSNKAEKENKSNTLNKNHVAVKGTNTASTVKPKAGTAPAAPRTKTQSKTAVPEGNQAAPTGNAYREKRVIRNNTRSSPRENNNAGPVGNDFGNEVHHRQFRDREYKGPPKIRNGEKFGKREFDRQSGSDKTGIKAVDKRDGGGAHNWGSAKQDIDDMNKTGEAPPANDKEDSSNEQSGDPVANTEEDESKQMTLDEWKALRDQRAKPNYNLRKAGEGVDNSEWKKMVVLSKKRDMDSEDDLEYDPSMYPQRVGRLQRIVDIQFNFNDNRRGGFRKGGPRGLPRGGFRPENGPTNGYERNPTTKFGGEKRRTAGKPLKVDDELQFPTLS